MNNQKIPKLVAHRGYMERYPENSWLGLKAAIDAGACWLEFDIQMCADGQFILIHDSDFMRIADTGISVFETNADEINSISAHEPNRFGDKFYPLQISTLDSVLERLSGYPQVNYMVEIKEESLERWGVAMVVDRLLDILQPYSESSVLISFNYSAVEYAKNNSDIRIGLVLNKYDKKHNEYAVSLNPDFLICNYRKLPANTHPWDGPWEWMLYEINTPHVALKWCEQGIKYIETGDIGLMLENQILFTQACTNGL